MAQYPLKLRVRNVLGISKADIDLSAIILVAGINAAGKSSLCEAVASAVCKSPLARGLTSKRAAAAVLRRGTDKGSIFLDYGPGSIRITYPDCEVEQAGKPPQLGTPLGIGSARFMALKPEERARQISERFKTEPTIDDLRAWAREHPEAGLKDHELDDGTVVDLVADLWGRIDVQGWDAEHRAAVEHGTKLKGRWEAASGQKWGTKIIKTWCPNPLLPGEEYDLAAAQHAVTAAQAHLDELIGYAAVAQADIEKLEQQSLDLEDAQKALEGERVEGAALARQLEELVAQKNAKDAPVDTSNLPACPHCGKKLRLVKDRSDRYTFVEKAPDPLAPKALAAARAAIEELDRRIEHLQRSVAENGTKTAAAAARMRAAETARRSLLDAQSRPKVAEKEVENARGQLLDAQRKAQAIDAMQKAMAIAADWERHTVLIDGLAPDGIRRTVMSRKLSGINATLGEFCGVAKFADVALTDDLDATYDDRPYTLLSESEKWRVDLVLACLIGQQESARLMIVDRFDVLNAQARPGVIHLLRHVGIPALVAMTAKVVDDVPNLEKAGVGTVRWLDRGELVLPPWKEQVR